MDMLSKISDFYNSSPLQAKLFICIAAPFCLAIAAVSPPMQAADESQHYLRAYQVSSFSFTTEKFQNRYGTRVPESVASFASEATSGRFPYANGDPSTIKKYLHTVESGAPTKVFIENTLLNHPIAYIPQATGIGFGKVLNLPLAYGFYLGRILNLLVFLLLAFLAIRALPVARWTFLTIALLPMTLYQASSLSPDALLIGLSFIIVSLLIRIYADRRVDTSQLIILCSLIASLSLIKQVYVLLIIPTVAALSTLHATKRSRLIATILIIAACVLPALLWNVSVSNIASTIHEVYRPDQVISPDDRLARLLMNPFGFLIIAIKTLLFYSFLPIIQGVFGTVGWLDIHLPGYCYYLAFTLLLLATLKDAGSESRLPGRFKFIMLLTGSLLLFAVCALLFIGYTSNEDNFINGIQGRYFIPLLLIVLPVLISEKVSLKIDSKSFGILFICSYLTLLISLIFVILDTNYFNLIY